MSLILYALAYNVPVQHYTQIYNIYYNVYMSHLIIEDNACNRFIIKSYLEKMGYNITEASNGFDALELAKHQNYDAIWTDINMPKIDGIQFTKILRQDLHYKKPIIAITACCDFNSVKCCTDAGMTDVLSKPIRMCDIRKCAKKHYLKTT